MLKALIEYKGATLILDFPSEMNINEELRSFGIDKTAQDIPITDDETADIKVKLFSESDFGNKLVPMFNSEHTLTTVRVAVDLLTKASDEIKELMEADILYDQYENINDVFDDVKKYLDEACVLTEKYYFPLTGNIDEGDGNMYTVGDAYMNSVADEIKERLDEINSRDCKNMAEYYNENDTLKLKLISADWDLEYKGETFYGVVTVKLQDELTEEETEKLKKWILGQNVSGIGESMESHEIDSEDGSLFVSFWHGGNDYFIHSETEMDEYINQTQNFQIGGM